MSTGTGTGTSARPLSPTGAGSGSGPRPASADRHRLAWGLLIAGLGLPLVDLLLPANQRVTQMFLPVLVFAIIGLGLNVVTGFTGLLNLGSAAFAAIGAYTFAIATCPIYPFQIGFWAALALALVIGAGTGLVLGLPTMRLRGDYLAIVTLGFGEIVQDALRNLDAITNGTQGLNPVGTPRIGSHQFTSEDVVPWYYLLLVLLVVALLVVHNLLRSRVGRRWLAVREDELAARAMGINAARAKLSAFAIGAALCAGGGALWASLYGTSAEPGYYDFQLSVTILCIVIVGGLGSPLGVVLGALIMILCNNLVLTKLAELAGRLTHGGSGNVLAAPDNWKYLVFGLALILMMRLRPAGVLPERIGESATPPRPRQRSP